MSNDLDQVNYDNASEFTQVELEHAMWHATKVGEDIVRLIRERGDEFESAEATYRTAKATEMLRLFDGGEKMTQAEREARVTLATEAHLFKRNLARSKLNAAKAAANANEAGQSTLRSLNANLRSHVTG